GRVLGVQVDVGEQPVAGADLQARVGAGEEVLAPAPRGALGGLLPALARVAGTGHPLPGSRALVTHGDGPRWQRAVLQPDVLAGLGGLAYDRLRRLVDRDPGQLLADAVLEGGRLAAVDGQLRPLRGSRHPDAGDGVLLLAVKPLLGDVVKKGVELVELL